MRGSRRRSIRSCAIPSRGSGAASWSIREEPARQAVSRVRARRPRAGAERRGGASWSWPQGRSSPARTATRGRRPERRKCSHWPRASRRTSERRLRHQVEPDDLVRVWCEPERQRAGSGAGVRDALRTGQAGEPRDTLAKLIRVACGLLGHERSARREPAPQIGASPLTYCDLDGRGRGAGPHASRSFRRHAPRRSARAAGRSRARAPTRSRVP